MKLGLIGRCDDRGIGYQTLEFYRHMPVDRVLAVLVGEKGFPEDAGRFRGDVVHVDSNVSIHRDRRGLDERKVRSFLEGLDVVFAVETVYDWRMIDWAHEMGVKVVVQGNPEFYVHHVHGFAQPDRWVWPTDWRHDTLREVGLDDDQLEVVPVPTVSRDFTSADPADDVLRVLHVVGRPALADRAGTMEVVEAIAACRQPVHFTLTAQGGSLPSQIRTRSKNVTFDVQPISRTDRWDLYAGHHVLLSPRHYGGLHLPAIEALSCGLAVVMPDCSPNATWPGPRMKARMGPKLRVPLGSIPTHTVHPLDIAMTIDGLAKNRVLLVDEMDRARRWADQNSWAELADRIYMPMFEDVLS